MIFLVIYLVAFHNIAFLIPYKKVFVLTLLLGKNYYMLSNMIHSIIMTIS